MNDEIKEILDKWECYIGLTKKFSNNDMELLRVEDIEKVLDYITNLQQEIEKLNDDKRGMLVQLYKANDNRDKAKQENERLKKDVELFKSDLISSTNTGLSLITKIDKAVEYIQNNMQYDDNIDDNWVITNDLLNILQGENNGD